MPRMLWTSSPARPRLATLGLVGAILLAGCGGSASQAPTGDEGSSAPVESAVPMETPTSTEETTETPAPGDGSEAFSAATTALDALDSYAFLVEINSTSVSGGVTSTSHSRYEGVVVNRPTEANTLTMAELDADGNVTSGTDFVVIGADAWMKDAADTAWTALPAAQAGAFIETFMSFRPEQIFGTYFAGFGGAFTQVGTESKNGIDCTHYQGDESVGAILGAIAGVSGTWTSDVWIANDGGFLVHSEAGAKAEAGSDGGSYLIVVDISDPNSAGPIEPPA